MFNTKKIASILLVLTMLLALLASCSQVTASEESTAANAQTTDTQSAETTGEKTEIQFWHSMSGNNQEQLMVIVDGYNASQDEYIVTATNQGVYDESTAKFFNMNGADGSPHLIQIGEQNLQAMIDSQLVASVTDLIAEHNFDDSVLVPQVMNFYTVNENMYAMPFNVSSPVVFYNADALAAAGVTEVPTTFEGILEIADDISAANNGMKAFSFPVYGYALDQMVTNMGGMVVNNDNGRTERTTEVAYQEEAIEILTWVTELMAADQFVNYGTGYENLLTGFNQGEVAMFIHTSALAGMAMAGAPFEIGITNLPVPEGTEAQGVYAAGGAVCVAANLEQNIAAGAMDFLTYATSAEVQAVWAGATGYFPTNVNSYETDTMVAIYEETPQLKVAADQFLNSKETVATNGPLVSLLPQLRSDLQVAQETVYNGGDPTEAINSAAESTNKQIETANASLG